MKFNLNKFEEKGTFGLFLFVVFVFFSLALWGAIQRLSSAFKKSIFLCPPRYGFVILCKAKHFVCLFVSFFLFGLAPALLKVNF
jgi:hypothetical protein